MFSSSSQITPSNSFFNFVKDTSVDQLGSNSANRQTVIGSSQSTNDPNLDRALQTSLLIDPLTSLKPIEIDLNNKLDLALVLRRVQIEDLQGIMSEIKTDTGKPVLMQSFKTLLEKGVSEPIHEEIVRKIPNLPYYIAANASTFDLEGVREHNEKHLEAEQAFGTWFGHKPELDSISAALKATWRLILSGRDDLSRLVPEQRLTNDLSSLAALAMPSDQLDPSIRLPLGQLTKLLQAVARKVLKREAIAN